MHGLSSELTYWNIFRGNFYIAESSILDSMWQSIEVTFFFYIESEKQVSIEAMIIVTKKKYISFFMKNIIRKGLYCY